MKDSVKKRLLVFLISAFLLLNLAFLFKIELINKFANISIFQLFFYPSKMALRSIDFVGEGIDKLKKLSRAYDMLIIERREREKLEVENLLLKEKVMSLERMKTLEEFRKRYPFKIEYSRVISRNPVFWHQHVIIEGGEDKEFKPGMPVMTKDGLVGKITMVYKEYSRVLLLTDPEFSVDVRGVDSEILALCSGLGVSVMKINYVPRFEEFKIGELVVTSGLDMSVPPGIPVGYLIEVNKPFGSYFLDAYVIPVVDVLKLRDVIVIKEFSVAK